MKITKNKIIAALITAGIILGSINMQQAGATVNSAQEQKTTEIAQDGFTTGHQQYFKILSADELVKDMGAGWNLGNTMDGHTGFTPNELQWQNDKTTKTLIKSIHDLGFNTVRIPVTWGTKIDDNNNYQIDEAWISRVQDIVDYCISQDMYAIINIHHDGAEQTGWLRIATDDQETLEKKFAGVWKNIANRFRDYDEHLIFESMNEVQGINMTPAKENSVIMKLNQIFTNTVRATGSNNSERWLMMPGKFNYIDSVCNEKNKFALPEDTVPDRLIVSVHYYTPGNFCGATTNISDSYTKYDLKKMAYNNTELKPLYDKYTSKGIPVVVGEYGCNNKDNPVQREFYIEGINRIFKKYKLAGIYWDQGWYDRSQKSDYSFSIIDRAKCQPIEKNITDGLMRGFNGLNSSTDYSTLKKKPEIIPVTSLSVSKQEVSLQINETAEITTTHEPSNSNDVILWKTDNPCVATVAYGKINAKGTGTATITAFTQNSTIEQQIKVTVTDSVPSRPCISLETAKHELNLDIGGYEYTSVKLSPSDTDETLYFTSSDENVATVSSIGKVLATGEGSAVITVSSTGGIKQEIKVNVSKKETEKKLNLSINVYYNDSTHNYFANETGKDTICVTDNGTYTLTFDCSKDLSDAAKKAGVKSLEKLTAIYIKDYDVASGKTSKSPLKTCQIKYDEIDVDGVQLTIKSNNFKSALKDSGIFDTNDPVNSWDGSVVEEVQASGGVANFKGIKKPQKITIKFTLSELEFGGQEETAATAPPANNNNENANNSGNDGNNNTPGTDKSINKIKKGIVIKSNGLEYKVTKTGNSNEAAFNGISKDLLKENPVKIKIPAKVKLSGKVFKITSIAANACKGNKQITKVIIGSNITRIGKMAFYNCKSLSSINIKCTGLKSVGKNALAGINSNAIIECNKNKKTAYTKLFTTKTGYKDTMKIKS
ncbi:MAG: cellulase family glycosylhydrolase [Lachnospiraceae bacterium]|nr:cellulase family glycosylhydrolase [Lachnospiraceae bacterium]